MADNSDPLADVLDRLEEARLAYGTVLLDDELRMVECLDRTAFEDDDAAELARATAYASVNADLVPFVMDHRDDFSTVDLIADEEPDRITGFDGVANTLPDARAYYFVAELGDGRWNRVRNVVPDRFDQNGVIRAPDAGRFAVAKTLVDEARERIGDLPGGVEGEEIDIIDWSS